MFRLLLFTFPAINGILIAMKKICIILLFFLHIFLFSSGLIFPKSLFRFGAYGGYFAPRNESLQQVYKKQDVIYGAKFGVTLWRGLDVWLTGMQYKQDGTTTLLKDRTQLTLTPLTLSLRYTLRAGFFNPYVGAGYSYVFYKEVSDIGSLTGEGKGYTLDAGIEFKLSRNFSLDLGLAYSDIKVKPTGFDVQLGGLQLGLAFILSI